MALSTPLPISGEWQPLGSWDLVAISISCCVDTVAMLLMLHVLLNRRWLPYMTKIPYLIVYTALSAVFASLAVMTRYGMLGSEGRTKPVFDCNVEVWLLWLSAGAFFLCGFLRMYRYYRVLICCDGSMWPDWAQLMASMLLFAIPPWLYTRLPDMVVFDSATQECEPQTRGPEVFGLFFIVFLVVVSVFLTFRLRVSYLQAPEEFQIAVVISTFMVFTVIIFPVVHVTMEDNPVGRRRVMLVATSLISPCVLIPPFVSIALRIVTGRGRGLERSDSYGLGHFIRSEDIRRMTQERMKINVLVSTPGVRDLPAAFAMAWFYRDSLDRQLIKDYYLLQASTMRIINSYVRPGAPMPLPISQRCQATILGTSATSAFIFGRARREIMTMISSISMEQGHGGENAESTILAAGPSPANESVVTEGTGETKDPTPLQSAEKIESAWLETTAPPISTAAPAEAPGRVPLWVAQCFRPSNSRLGFGRIPDNFMISADSKVHQSMEISATEGAGRWMKEAGCALSTQADVNQAFGLSSKDDGLDSSDGGLFHECWMLKKSEELAGETKSPVCGSSSSSSSSRFSETLDVREAMGIKNSPRSFQDEQEYKVALDNVSDLEAGCESAFSAANPLSCVSPSIFSRRDGVE